MGRSKRRRLGQTFLIDSRVAEQIVGLLAVDPPRVLEIGPGCGALTEPLLKRFDRVIALELDPLLVPQLSERFGSAGLEVHNNDALKDDFEPLLGSEGPWQVASNLPYSVGTAILRRLLPRSDLFSRLVVMLQREVAHRVVAEPGGNNHGLIALERAAWGEAHLLFDVSPRAFRPTPKVVSSVIVVDLKPPQYDPDELAGALSLAARALTRPRKVLTNALAPEVELKQLENAGLDPTIRPGSVPLEDWVGLARTLAKNNS